MYSENEFSSHTFYNVIQSMIRIIIYLIWCWIGYARGLVWTILLFELKPPNGILLRRRSASLRRELTRNSCYSDCSDGSIRQPIYLTYKLFLIDWLTWLKITHLNFSLFFFLVTKTNTNTQDPSVVVGRLTTNYQCLIPLDNFLSVFCIRNQNQNQLLIQLNGKFRWNEAFF